MGDPRTPTRCKNFRVRPAPGRSPGPHPPPDQALPTFQVAALRLRVRPRLVRVLFMRKEKHRSVGASGFFLDKPGEGEGRSGPRGSCGQGLVLPAPWLERLPSLTPDIETWNQRRSPGVEYSPSDHAPSGPQDRPASPQTPGQNMPLLGGRRPPGNSLCRGVSAS